MIKKAIGRTDEWLAAIGQGVTGTGSAAVATPEQDQSRIESIRAGLDAGLQFIDTAELYGGGHSEEVVGKAVAGRRAQVFLASKFKPENSSPQALSAALDRSLARLRTDYLDLYQMHWPTRRHPVEETIGALLRFKEEGKIRHIGLGNVSLDELKRACRVTAVSTVQMEYNLAERDVEDSVLPFCQANGVTMIAYSPLDQGRVPVAHPLLQNLAAKYQASVQQIILRWLIAKPNIMVVSKSGNPGHTIKNAAALDLPMDAQDVKAIDQMRIVDFANVPAEAIRVDSDGHRPVYRSEHEARANALDLIPHPEELADRLKSYGFHKRPRLVAIPESEKGNMKYRLIGEQLSFWAWVIAFGWQKPMPSLVYAHNAPP